MIADDDWDDLADEGWEPDESSHLDAQAAHDYELHCKRVHGGKDCDCPAPGLAGDGPFDTEAPF